jgi:hypothetical protein
MSILPNLLRSLLLTGIFSFVTPSLFIGGLWGGISLIGAVPGFAIVGQVGRSQLSHFLSVFGNGSVLQGLLVIGLVCSLVGIMFDTFTFYRQQNLRDS